MTPCFFPLLRRGNPRWWILVFLTRSFWAPSCTHAVDSLDTLNGVFIDVHFPDVDKIRFRKARAMHRGYNPPARPTSDHVTNSRSTPPLHRVTATTAGTLRLRETILAATSFLSAVAWRGPKQRASC